MLKKLKNKKGFSLVELIIAVAILAVLAVVLVPTLTKHVEKTRAQRDVSAMDEVVSAVKLAMSDQDCYDEMFNYSCANNYITYTDSSGNYGQQINDEEYWAPDGAARATTITFNPIKGKANKTHYSMNQAVVNDMSYGNGSMTVTREMVGAYIDANQCYLKNTMADGRMVTSYTYSKVLRSIGDEINIDSATYRNSSYTVFIVFSDTGMESVSVNGSFNGTNINAASQSSVGSDTTEYENGDLSKPVENPSRPTPGLQPPSFSGSTLIPDSDSGVTIVPDYKQDENFGSDNGDEGDEPDSSEPSEGETPGGDTPGGSGDNTSVAYAVYSDEDNSLTFYKNNDVVTVGSDYKNKKATAVYTGFETEEYDRTLNSSSVFVSSNVPWYEHLLDIKSISFHDEIVPISTKAWFAGAKNLTSFNGTNLNTKNVIDMTSMFHQAGNNSKSLLIEGLDNWNVSNVKNMAFTFYCVGYSADKLAIDGINNWNTSSVESMHAMFGCAGLSSADWSIGDLSAWDTSKVTVTSYMFGSAGKSAEKFDVGDLSNWDTSNVTDMHAMFREAGYSAPTFDIGDLRNWNTSKVTSMNHMFNGAGYNASTFYLDLTGWDTSAVTNMQEMFSGAGTYAKSFTIVGLNNWDVSNVTNMKYMFNYSGHSATTWNIGDLSTKEVTFDGNTYTAWNTASVKNMFCMFQHAGRSAEIFDIGDIGTWDVSNVEDMTCMFSNAGYSTSSFDIGDLSNWDTSNVTNMSGMFKSAGYSAPSFDIGNIGTWNTSNVTNMANMFDSAGYNATTWSVGKLFTKSVTVNGKTHTAWNTSSVTNMDSMFREAGYNATAFNIGDLSNWDTSKVTNMDSMFCRCKNLTSLDLSNWNTSSVTSMWAMFYECFSLDSLDISGFNTTNVTNMSSMFYNCSGLTNLDVSNFDTSKVTNMSMMFSNCSGLTSLDLSGFNTAQVTNMYDMFYSCSGLTNLDISSFNTAQVTNMYAMFYNCSGLTSLEVSSFNTAQVTNMSMMFYNCSGLTNLDVSNFDTSKVANTSTMFSNCSKLTNLDVSNFDTSKVTNMSYMFNSCSGLTSLDLSSFDTDQVTNMSMMFYGCSKLTAIYASDKWVADNNVTSSSYMYYGCTKLVGGAGTTYDSTNTDKTYAHIDGGASNPGYLSSFAGLIKEDGTRIYWDELVSSGAITVSGTTITGSDKTNIVGKLIIPNGITVIGNRAFYNGKLTEVILPDSITHISDESFSWNPNISKIDIPKNVSSIASGAFGSCVSLSNINVDANNEYYCSVDGALYNKNVTTIIIVPRGKTSYTMPKTVTSILSGSSIYNTSNIIKFEVETGNTKYVAVDGAIYTKDLKAIVAWPSGRTGTAQIVSGCETITVGTFAYSDANVLYIPSSVKTIESSNIYGMDNLTDIYYAGTEDQWNAISIESGYQWIDRVTIHYNAAGLFKSDGSFTSWDSLVESGVVTVNGTTLTRLNQNVTGNLVIPTSITSIGDYAINNIDGLTGVTIPNTIVNIGNENFEECSKIETVFVPASVKTIGLESFASMRSLKSIDVDSNNSVFCSIDGVLFDNQVSRIRIYPSGKSGASYTIPDGVTHIGACTFRLGCKLTELRIPKSMKYIGSNNGDRWNTLKDIYYEGTEAEWNMIGFDVKNDTLLNATVHYNTK